LSNSQTEEKQGREARGTSEKARKQKTEIPAEWLPHQQSMQNGEALGLSVAEIQIEAQKFRNYARQDARRSADWDAGFDNWLIRAAEYRGLKLGATPKPSGEVISFPTLPGSPQWHVWKAHHQDTGALAMVRELNGRELSNRAFNFPSEWPP